MFESFCVSGAPGEDITPLTVNEACQINQFWAVKSFWASSVHVACVKDLVEMFLSLLFSLVMHNETDGQLNSQTGQIVRPIIEIDRHIKIQGKRHRDHDR